jgi:hypothetical protein
MGRHAQCAWIFRVFAIVFAMASPAFAVAAVTADAVALGAGAGCSNGRLDVTLTNNGATWESWSATNLAGNTLTFGEQFTGFPPGTSTRSFPQNFSPSQPDGTLIGSYAYVGEPSPDAANAAEFFIFYKCSLAGAEILLACKGPYGTCPQTAQQALARLTAVQRIPTLGPLPLALMAMLLAGAGGLALARRT